MRRIWVLVIGWLCLPAAIGAQANRISEAEALNLPTPPRLSSLRLAAEAGGWEHLVPGLRAAAVTAYERGKLPAAEAWLNVYRWAAVFAEKEAQFVPRWMAAVNAAKVGHSNLGTRFELRPRPLAARLSPELQAWMLGHGAFSAEFFSVLTQVDFLPRVLEILNELHQRAPARFKTHASLALAIAVVYDVAPPPFWPHSQVTPALLPRQLPSTSEAFDWWTRQEQLGRLHHRLSRLGADELKFVVDAAAPFAELEWAQGAANVGLGQLAKAYTMIRYRMDRVTGNVPLWTGRTYQLSEILATGGICSDQAYFATQVGKARGVPTLLIYGAGNDGRHAWFGYLDGNQKWQLDAGRYAEQRFVTGYARDPQTWREFSDHELKFLSEGFRALPSFKASRIHVAFAEDFLAQGRAPAAGAAARKGVNFERRNQAGWETLIGAARAEGRDARTIENLLREAALAFQRYPDLEAGYVNRVADSLRARGQASAADNEVRGIAIKNRGERGDLSVQQARDIVRRAIASQPLPEQVKAYNTVVDTYGRGAGIGFFDSVVSAFVDHLMQLNQKAEAMRALDRARRALRIEPDSQLASDLERLAQAVKASK